MNEPLLIEGYLGNVYSSEDFINDGLEVFHSSSEEMKIGDTLDSADYLNRRHYQTFFKRPPNYSAFPDRDFVCKRNVVERVFEKIRIEKFPDRPSRKNAIFCNWRNDDAIWWANHRNVPRIYRFGFEEPGTCSVHNVFWFDFSVNVLTENHSTKKNKVLRIRSQAEKYWSGSRGAYPAKYEVLISGKVIIVEKFDSNGMELH